MYGQTAAEFDIRLSFDQRFYILKAFGSDAVAPFVDIIIRHFFDLIGYTRNRRRAQADRIAGPLFADRRDHDARLSVDRR